MTDEKMVEELEAEESMFVQTAESVTSDGTTLTLHGVTPSTLYFSDRPQRVVGHMTTSDFVDLWGEGANSFEENRRMRYSPSSSPARTPPRTPWS